MIDGLLNELARLEIRLVPHRGRLHATGAPSRLTAELKAELKRHKLELMARVGAEQVPALSLQDQLVAAIRRSVLAADLEAVMADVRTAHQRGLLDDDEFGVVAQEAEQRGPLAGQIEDVHPRDWEDTGGSWQVTSVALGDTVLWAADNALIAADNSLVVYRASELRAMLGASAEVLRAAHMVKKELDGEVIEPDEDAIEIPIEMLLEPATKSGRCNACGQDQWWTSDGRRICGVCHPSPATARSSDDARRDPGERLDEGRTS